MKNKRIENILGLIKRRIPYTWPVRRLCKLIVQDSLTLLKTIFLLSYKRYQALPPRMLYIEPTNFCNAKCVFCAYQYQETFRKERGFMRADILNKALVQYKDMGGKKVGFTPLVGESLLHPEIISYLTKAKHLGFKVEMFTNGILFEDVGVDKIISTGIDTINWSTAPLDRESVKLIYGVDCYEKLINGTRKLLEARNSSGSKLFFRILFRSHIPGGEVFKKSAYLTQIYPLLSERERKEVYCQIKGFDNWGGLISQKDLPGDMALAVAPSLKIRPCEWTYRLIVLWDGKVRACGCRFAALEKGEEDRLIAGDLNKENLKDIWFGRRLKEIRESFIKRRLYNVCRRCTMYRPI